MAPKDERLGAGRTAQGHRSDGTPSVMRASSLPSHLTYGEFDLDFFAELVTRAAVFRKGFDGSSASLSFTDAAARGGSGSGGDDAPPPRAPAGDPPRASVGLQFMDAGSGVGARARGGAAGQLGGLRGRRDRRVAARNGRGRHCAPARPSTAATAASEDERSLLTLRLLTTTDGLLSAIESIEGIRLQCCA